MIPGTPLIAQRPSWQQQWRDAVREPAELLRALGLQALADRVSASAMAQFPLRVPQAYLSRIRHGDAQDPLLRQVLPVLDEDRIVPGFDLDAVGDTAAKAAQGVIHKYQGRALLIATGSCAIHCRYCFRRHFPYAEETAAAADWNAPLAYLREHSEVNEVILSGGDPLSLSTAKLRSLTEGLAGIPHIARLRLHTRLPIVLPDRVDDELLAWLSTLPWPTSIVLHANHANEFDAAVDQACAALRKAGVTLLNQAVLLAGVNDDADRLAALCERGFQAGVLPYYLHQLDRVQGAAHFLVDDERALELHRALHTRLPGYLVPRLVREIPGQPGKSPLR